MQNFFLIVLATFFAAFSRALQNQNIVAGNYVPAMVVPFLIAASDVGIIVGVVSTGWSAVVPMGIGGAFGAVSAMVLHRRVWGKPVVRCTCRG